MSHIFDALQRSAAERSGIERPPLLATELLQAVEREVAAERERTAACEPRLETKRAVQGEAVAEPHTSGRKTAELSVAAELSTKDAGADQFSQFQSLQVSPPLQSKVVCVTDEESLAAEKFRFLGVRLRQLQQRSPLRKVLITSTVPQEGKSVVVANLACTLARRTQQKTLLLDGDLRRPSCAQLFGLGQIPGISEWLQGKHGPLTSIYHLEGPGLFILPAGSTPKNPLELMQSGTLSAIMDQLSTWFDWIVIDSPPVLPLGDTSIWMRLADGVLLVTRQGTTEKEQLQRGLEAIEPAKLLGALLNCSTNTAHSEYYYRYGPRAASQPTDHPEQ